MSIKNRERDVEKYSVTRLGEAGFPCVKFSPENSVGMPDRMVLLPEGKVIWLELKTDGGKLSEIQRYRHRRLKDIGHDVRVLWSREDVDRFVAELNNTVHQQ